MMSELLEGVAWVVGYPYLRTISMSSAWFILFGS